MNAHLLDKMVHFSQFILFLFIVFLHVFAVRSSLWTQTLLQIILIHTT